MCNIFALKCLLCAVLISKVWSQVCPYGWMDRPRGDSCYRIEFANMKYTWTEGRARCQQLQANLFKLDNVQERDWVMQTLRNMTAVYPDATDWWSGVYNKGDGKGWIWAADDTPVDNSLIQWSGGTVPSNDGQKHCADVNGQRYNSSNCNIWRRIICERLKSTPLLCDSDGGWVYSNGSCYKFVPDKRTWDDASAKCKEQMSHLSQVSGEDSQRFLWDMSRENKQKTWIGLKSTQSGNSVSWNWDQGPALDKNLDYWAPDNPGTIAPKDLNSTCIVLGFGLRRKQSWVATSCSEVFSFSCQKPQGICQDGWLQHQDVCFSFNPLYSLPWDKAQKYCAGQGAKLLQLKSASDQTFINLYMKEQKLAGINSLWMGITDNNNAGNFVWGDGSATGSYTNWAPKNPTDTPNVQDCGYIDTTDSTGRWQTSGDCTVPRSFVCMIPVNTVVKPITTPAPNYLCDDGWFSHGKLCYSFNDTDSSWLQSRDNCQNLGGDLAVIPDQSTQEFLNGHIDGADFWIGLQDRSQEKQFSWIDSTTQLTYTHWNKGEPNNMGNENCVAMLGNWGKNQFGKWNDYDCSRKYNFICQKNSKNDPSRTPPTPTVKPVLSKKCGAFWEESPNSDYCYQFNTGLLSWMDAKDMCMHHGGNLASITSVQEQFYIAGRIKTMTLVALWTGANDRSSEGGWKWEDGSPFAYMNWAPGEPNDYGSSEDCGIITVKSAKWNDYDCPRRNGYICKKLGNVQATTVQPSTSPMTVPAGQVYGCPGGWKPYLNSCYLVVKTGVSWTQAKAACRKAGGDLASVANKAENQFINSQIQRGLNDGVWIGMNDLQTTNSFVWTDGSPRTFTNWARNEPNNYQGHQEDCVLMYTYGGQWNDDTCDVNHGYVCKTQKQIRATTQKSPFAAGCPDGALGYQHYCYQFNYSPLTWQAAEVTCRLRKGHLATVNDYVIQSFLASELTTRSDLYWIGLSDKTTPGTYKWNTGEKLMYTPWDKSHNGSERSTCVAMRTTKPTGLWQNVQCNVIKPYICQLPRAGFTPAPTTPTPTTGIPLPCSPGWQGYQSFCYKAFRMSSNQRKTWSQALVYCQGLGGDLMSIHSKDQENFIEKTLLQFFYNANFWIGFTDRTKEGSWEWSDGTPADYANWYRTEPNNSDGDEDCAEFNQFTRQWNDNTCSASKDFICQIPRGVTVPTTTIQTTTPIIACAGTEKGWDYYNGHCYFVSPSYGTLAKKSWYEARRYCMSEGGDLASIHNLQENNYLTAIVTKRSQGVYWIGLNQLGRDDYVWSDGTPSDFLKWRPGEPNDAYGGQLCVNMYGGTISGPGSWNDDNCMDSYNYICKRSNGTLSTVTPAPTKALTGGCPASFTLFGNKCFAVGGLPSIDRMNWTDAREQCRKQGKRFDIASINSYAEQAFLLVYVKSLGTTSPLWIGLNDRYQNGHYEWQDNSEVTFTNWNKGEPSDHYSYSTYNRQDCVTMYTESGERLGRWNDDKCTEKRGYICQTYRSSTYVTPTPAKSTCKANYKGFSTSCYRVVTSPTTWQLAQTACKADGGNLVSISDLYEQSFIDILVTNNNIVAGFWMGLSDKKTPGIYGWYDGWPVSFTRWGKGEPTRNTGEGCVAQQGRFWNDTVCDQNLPFICEINSATPPPTTPIPPGFCPDKTTVPHGEYCYYAAPTERKSFPEADFICHQKGMELVSVHSKAELDFLKTLLDEQTTTPRYSYYFSKPNVWLGLSKTKSGGFAWSDGSPANYFNWNKGEPSDTNGTHHENCVEYYRTLHVWNDVDCFQDRAFICKTPKTLPSTTPQTTTSTTTTTTKKPKTSAPSRTKRPQPKTTTRPAVTYKHITPHRPRINPLTGMPKPVFQNPGTSNNLNGGEIAGILIGAIAFIAIVVAILFIIKRRRAPPLTSPENGFANALYSKDTEDVSVANGTTSINHYESGVPSISEA